MASTAHHPATSVELNQQVRREKVRHTIEHVIKTQKTTPLGWLVVLGMVSTRTAVGPTLAWIAAFAVLLVMILVPLQRMRSAPDSLDRKTVRLHLVAVLDGLGWGLLPLFVFGADAVLDSWLVTVLCGVAAVNAPPRALMPTAYAAQLFAMWLPIAYFGIQTSHVEGSIQMVIGVAVFMSLLLVYVRSVERVMSNNILLRLHNADLSAQLQISLSHVEREAATDPLTEQANRREMNRVLVEVDRRRRSDGGTYSLLMLDIDHFKQINDRSGHLAGDAALRAVAEEVRRLAGPLELPCRLGGDEFALVLRVSDDGELANRALGLMSAVRSLRLPSLREHRLSVSIGGAFCEDPGGWSNWYSQADRSLYEAKRQGGDHWRLAR